jgi:hypothetical protein
VQKHNIYHKQDSKIPPKVNKLAVTEIKGSEEEESPDKELKGMIIRMINEM